MNVLKKKTKCYIYTRVSTAIQVDGYSLDAQKDKLRKYAEFQDMEIVGEYSDEGHSGKNIKGRQEFMRMLNDIEDGKDRVDFVLVFKLSRFGRNAADVLSSLQLMQDYGVNLICVEDGIDSSKEAGKLLICHVLGMVHKLDNKENEIAVRISNYYPEYNPETNKSAPTQLIDYFYIAEEQLCKTGEFAKKIDWICKGILKLIKISSKKEMKYSSSAFRTIVRNVPSNHIREKLLVICDMDYSSPKAWDKTLECIYELFSDYISKEKMKMEKFVEWKGGVEKEGHRLDDKSINKILYTDDTSGRSVELQFGSIHSSKGRTHLATLILETKYYEYNLSSILPWIAGKKGKLGQRNKQRLKCQYVAMTRAKGLICLAMLEDNVSSEMQKELIDYGWNVKIV